MVDQLLQLVWPSGKADFMLYGCLMSLLLSSLIFILLAIGQRRKSRLLEQVMNRYKLVHRALDDFMALAVASLPLVVNSITSIRQLVAQNFSPEVKNTLQNNLANIQSVSQQIIQDNPYSQARSDTKDKIIYGTRPNPWRSSLIWTISLTTLAIMMAINYSPSHHLSIGVQLAGFLVSYTCLIGSYMHFGRARSLRRMIEREASLNMYLFNIRRDFIAHTGNKLQEQHLKLMTEGQPLSVLPETKNYFNGLIMLAQISKGILAVHHASDMSAAAPLLSVSATLENQIQKVYHPAAKQHGLNLTSQIDSGLAFRIHPKDFLQAINHLLRNAIIYNQPEGRIKLKAYRRSDRIIIEVTDTGKGLDKQTLDYLFRPLDNPQAATMPQKVSLGLQICKVILTRIGAELHVTTKPQQGTTATIVASRKFSDIALDIPQRIGARSNPIS